MTTPDRGRDAAAALAPLLLAVLWLPLLSGGADRGPLLAVQGLTFAALAWLAAKRRLTLPHGPLRKVVAALLAAGFAAALSTAFSRDLDASVPALIGWLWLGATGLLFLIAVEHARLRAILPGSLVAAAVVQTSWSFFVWWGGGDPAPAQSGTFYAPNQFAGYLLLLAPLLLVPSLTRPGRREAAAWGVMTVFVYLAIALSGSRAGAGAAILGAAVAAALAARSGLRRVLARAALLIVGFAAGGAFITSSLILPDRPSGGPAGVLRSVGEKEGSVPISAEHRLHWAQGALAIGGRSPVTGAGLGTYGDMLVQVMDARWAWSRYAHNHYLEAFAEGGLPLAAAAVALPAAAFAAGLERLRRRSFDPAEAPWRMAYFGGLAGASAHLVLDHDWSFPAYAVAYALVALLLTAPGARQEAPAPRFTRALGLPAAIAAGVCLLAVAGAALLPQALRSSGRMAIALAPYATGPRAVLADRLAADGADGLREAAALRRGAIALDELDPRLLWDLAAIYRQLDDLPGARAAYGNALRVAPNAPAAYRLAADFELTDAGDPRGAARILDRGIARLRLRPTAPRLAPAIAGLLLLRAEAEEQISGPAGALDFVREATLLAPHSPRAWLRRSELACLAGAEKEARDGADRARGAGATAADLETLSALLAQRC